MVALLMKPMLIETRFNEIFFVTNMYIHFKINRIGSIEIINSINEEIDVRTIKQKSKF